MKITNATFITSVADSEKFYKTDKPIIAISGKSNVGKSTLINTLAGQKKLAKTSDTPGRTRLINYFDFGSFVLADLPGYGYAKVDKAEKQKWAKLLEEFFATQKIDLLLSLIDIRHAPTEDDIDMITYLNHYRIPFTVIATKSDKLAKSKIKPQVNYLAGLIKVAEGNIIPVDYKGFNKDKVLAEIERIIK